MIQKKVCILGASGVGKTSLTRQFVESIFSDKYLTSIGAKIDKKVVKLPAQDVQLLIWDLEGIDRYCGFNPRYLRGASCFCIVVDQTREQSLTDGMEILKMAREHTDIPVVMAVNKSDLENACGTDRLDEVKDSFTDTFNTSAKTGSNVDNMFFRMAELSTQ